jgi:hypothetical protein
MHPDNHNKSYDRIEVPFLEKEMQDLMEFRKQQLLSQQTNTRH